MNISRPFILRPVATALLMGALLLSGALAYRLLPVSALPQVDYPTIRVLTFYPGASPEVMTSAVTAPLERQFGQIPGLDQMSSTSSGGASVLTLRFSLDKHIEVAEQEVQAAINAAGNLLPNDLPQPPVYNKVNPADTPVLTLSVTSPTMPLPAVYDLVDTRIAQKLSQLPGVGLVSIAGGQRPAVRIQANPQALAAHNLNLQNLRAVIAAANVNQPKGNFDGPERSFMLDANDQLRSVQAYKDLIIAYQDGAPLRLSDVAQVVDGAENTRLSAWADDAPAVLVNIQRQPGANVIDVVDRIRAVLPQLTASLPETVSVAVLSDRTDTIRASVRDVQHELVFAVALVVLVTFVFLRNIPATIIPSVVVPLSLIGTFGVMYLAGYSINNLTLMALTIATGFVVDDAIVMVENIARYLEEGATPMHAALEGARQIGFTLVSLTVSLIAVLIPLLFMADVVGRLFREFAITLAVSILISLVVSLTLTPMMCARLLKAEHDESHGRLYRATGYFLDKTIELYGRALNVALRYEARDARHRAGHDGADGLAVHRRPEGLLPGAGHRRHPGDHRGAADRVVLGDGRPAAGRRASHPEGAGHPRTVVVHRRRRLQRDAEQRPHADHADVARGASPQRHRDHRRRCATAWQKVPGITLYFQPVQDLTIEDRVSRTQFQFTLEDPDANRLAEWVPKLLARLQKAPALADVASDLQDRGLQAFVDIDRDAASRLGIRVAAIDDALYDAFGQRLISTIYTQANQYRVVLEIDPRFQVGPEALGQVFVATSDGRQVPLSSLATIRERETQLVISHAGQFPAVTMSFNLAPGASLGSAVAAIEEAQAEIRMPASVQTTFQGAAAAFRSSLDSTLLLVLAAIVTMYVVLGVLYESYIHPITHPLDVAVGRRGGAARAAADGP